MNLNQLRIFAAVAGEGSVTRAAKSLKVSQPAVSKQLAELESALEVGLVDRLPRGVQLTEAGRILQRHASTIFGAERAAETELAELRGLESGSVAVGASTTIGSYLLPPLLAEFKREFPRISPEIEIANTHHIQMHVLDGSLDFGLTEGLVSSELLDVEVVAHDEVILIAAPGSTLAKEQVLALDASATYPIILREPGSGTRDVVEAALRERGVELRPVMSLGSTEAVKNAVMSGLGIAFVSKLTVELELATEHLVCVAVPSLQIHRSLHLLTRRAKRLSHAAEAFVRLLPSPPLSAKASQ